MNVGIIGAGVLGLSTAFELSKKGHQVTLFERAPILGGQASTFDVGGGRLERGYHHLFRSDYDMVDLIQELGLGSKLAWIESKVGFYYGGRIYPFVGPKDLLRFTALSLVDRIRLGLVALYLRRKQDWPKLESYTAEAWISRWAGCRNYEVVWGPLLRAKFGANYEQVGMVWFWGKIFLRFASRGKGMKELLGYPMGSFGEVIETLAERIRQLGGVVRTATSVTRIVMEDGAAVGIETQDGDGNPTLHRFDHTVATVPSSVFLRLVPELPEEYAAKLKSVRYQAAVLVILVLNRPLTPFYWLNISDPEIPFVAVVEQTNFVPASLYGGKHLVYLSNYLGRENPLYHMQGEELLENYVPHLKNLNPDFDRSWIEEWHYHREDAAQPIIGTNYSQAIPELQTPYKNLILANTTQIYPEDRGTNYSIRLGRVVAKLLDPTVEIRTKAAVRIGTAATPGLH